MAYKDVPDIYKKLSASSELFCNTTFDELKKNIEKLIDTNNKPIPKRYVEIAIASFYKGIGGSSPVIYVNEKIEDGILFDEVRIAIKQCIDNLEMAGKYPNQDGLRSALEKMPKELVTETMPNKGEEQ